MDKSTQYSLANLYKKARDLYANSPVAKPIAQFQANNRAAVQKVQVPDTLQSFVQGANEGALGFTGLDKKIPLGAKYTPQTTAGKATHFAGGAVGYALGAGKLLGPVEKAIQGAVVVPKLAKSAPVISRAANFVARKTAPALIAEAATAVPTSIIQSRVDQKPVLPIYAQNLAGNLAGRAVGEGIGVAAPLVGKAGKFAVKETKEAVKKTDAEMFNRWINLTISEGDAVTSRLGIQPRNAIGNYGKKIPLIKAVGSGDILHPDIPLLKLVFEPGTQPQGIGTIIPATKLKEMPELAQYVQGPANKAAERLYKQAYSGGFIDLNAKIYGKDAIPKELQPLAEEARKHKTAEEFKKAVLNSSNLSQDPRLQTIDIRKIVGTDYPELDAALKSGKKLSISEVENIISATDEYKPGRQVSSPIEVRKNKDGTFSLQAGNHRLAQKLINGETTIPANVVGDRSGISLTDLFNKAKQQNPQGGFANPSAFLGSTETPELKKSNVLPTIKPTSPQLGEPGYKPESLSSGTSPSLDQSRSNPSGNPILKQLGIEQPKKVVDPQIYSKAQADLKRAVELRSSDPVRYDRYIKETSDWLNSRVPDKQLGITTSDTQFPQMRNQEVGQIATNLQENPQQIAKDILQAQPTKGSDNLTPPPFQSPTIEGQKQLQAKPQTLSSSASPYFNTKTYKITEDGKKVVEQAVEQVKPRLEKITGKTLSNKEVLQTADQSSKTLNKAVGRDQTLEWESALLKARQKLSALSEKGVVDKEYIDTLMTIKSLGTDIGRKLQSFSIGADPKLLTSKQAILEAVLKQADDADAVLKAAQGVDFNDLNQATSFYRQFIKPSIGDHLDLLRYNSMLSSPNTHINNIASNFQGTGLITPLEKTITGSLDALKSAFTGRPREYAVGEGAAYAKGYYSNVSKAVKNFTDVMTGKSLADNPDIRNIPMYPQGGPMGRVENALSLPMKLLEASDQFFTALTEGGETAAQKYKQSKGISLKGLTPDEAAAKRLFRSKLGDNQGSKVLNTIDALANVVQSAKTSKDKNLRVIANFTLPFLKTPTNILKQGLEYNPLGVATMIGAENKTEQLSKALIGSAGVGMGMLLGSDRLTAGEPTSEKQKNAFRAAGMQPYAVKIGDNWVSYSKLHPAISFPLAMVASIRDAVDKKKIDDGQAETALNGVAKFLKYFADQSYLKNLGDIIASNQGDIEGLTRVGGNYLQQGIPFRALMGWVTRLTDPYQRQVDKNGSTLDKQLQQLATQIPLVSQTVPARKDMFDNPIPNQNRLLNSFSPAKVTTEQPKAREEYNFLKEKAKLQSESTQLKNKLKSEAQNNVSVQKVGAAEDTFVPGTNKTPLPEFGGQSIKDAQVNQPVALSSQEKDKIGTYIQYGKSVSEKDLSNYFYGDLKTQASTSKYQQALHSDEVMKKINKIEDNEFLSDAQKEYLVKQGLSEVGITPQEYQYYKVAKQSSDLKSLYANEQLSKLLSTPGTTPNTVNNWLINGRKTVNGEQLLNDSVIKSLVDNGVIGKADGEYLKKVSVENGQVKVKQSTNKPKKLKMPKLKKIKVKKQKQIKLKPISLKLKVKKAK